MIAFGVCVGDEDTYRRYALPSICALAEPDTVLLSSTGSDSIFRAYNEMLDVVRGDRRIEGLVLLHEDVELRDAALLEKVRHAAATPDLAVLGAVGALGVKGLAWWDGIGRGRCAETRGVVDFGGGTHLVDAVDGMFMVLTPWVIERLCFDETDFVGFHGYDVDFCFAARAAGGFVAVTDVDLFHHTKGGFGDRARFDANDRVFRRKWDGIDAVHQDEDSVGASALGSKVRRVGP